MRRILYEPTCSIEKRIISFRRFDMPLADASWQSARDDGSRSEWVNKWVMWAINPSSIISHTEYMYFILQTHCPSTQPSDPVTATSIWASSSSSSSSWTIPTSYYTTCSDICSLRLVICTRLMKWLGSLMLCTKRCVGEHGRMWSVAWRLQKNAQLLPQLVYLKQIYVHKRGVILQPYEISVASIIRSVE